MTDLRKCMVWLLYILHEAVMSFLVGVALNITIRLMQKKGTSSRLVQKKEKGVLVRN